MKGMIFCDKAGIVVGVTIFTKVRTRIVGPDVAGWKADAMLSEHRDPDFLKKINIRRFFNHFT